EPKTEKNTCINAPAIVAAIELYERTKNPAYLQDAQRLMAWIGRLQDADGLFFDNQKLDGTIDRTKWSYNSALMIRANLGFYRVTREERYKTEAIRIGRASLSHWFKRGALQDEGSFAHHLAEALLELAAVSGIAEFRDEALGSIVTAANLTSPDGWYGLRWNRYEVRQGRQILLYQSSMARALWVAATK
ncbi:MAG: glycoside hydrolase family 76 protein, partial [Fimbriimonas sp.]